MFQKSKNRIIFLIIFLISTEITITVSCKQQSQEEVYKPFDHIQLIGHCGDYLNCPPNTMPAFESAVNNLGLHWIETDPQITKDGIIVLYHDNFVPTYTDVGGGVSMIIHTKNY